MAATPLDVSATIFFVDAPTATRDPVALDDAAVPRLAAVDDPVDRTALLLPADAAVVRPFGGTPPPVSRVAARADTTLTGLLAATTRPAAPARGATTLPDAAPETTELLAAEPATLAAEPATRGLTMAPPPAIAVRPADVPRAGCFPTT
ncbi:hypothetical protein [Actinoplanes philippinensis]|uniref:hypothetical protein n=1 Tax=Actinoplanes philippinensis TaxID=35752 RepID=UPI000B88655B|nr:hypothetical protein [Actinoplanes philippinensis]